MQEIVCVLSLNMQLRCICTYMVQMETNHAWIAVNIWFVIRLIVWNYVDVVVCCKEVFIFLINCTFFFAALIYSGADKSLARPGRKQATATEKFDYILITNLLH